MGIVALKRDFRRAVFLDRDGVLNRPVIRNGKPFPPASLEELEILAGVPEALDRLRVAGFLLIGATNQPDVARGKQSHEVVEAIHSVLLRTLSLDAIMVCYHDDKDNCRCRKPLPGLLLKAAEEHQIELRESFMVGDRWRDVEAGHNAGCTTVFIDYGYMEKASLIRPTISVGSLLEAANWILQKRKTK